MFHPFESNMPCFAGTQPASDRRLHLHRRSDLQSGGHDADGDGAAGRGRLRPGRSSQLQLRQTIC